MMRSRYWPSVLVPFGTLVPLILSAQVAVVGTGRSATAAPGLGAAYDLPALFRRPGPARDLPSFRCPPGDTLRLDSILDTVMHSYPIPGMATMIVQDGRVIWNRCYGYAIFGDSVNDSIPVVDTTCFSLASVSKTFTGTAAMQLWESGRFELDSSINQYLPFLVRHSRYPDSLISYKMLMTHTSAIRDNGDVILRYCGRGDPDSPLRAFLEDYFIPGRPGYDSAGNFYQDRVPGERYGYSNVAVTLLGLEVQMMVDSFARYTHDSIFRPLGMDRTTWFFRDLDTMSVACQYFRLGDRWYRFGYTSGSIYPVAFLKSCTRDLGTWLNVWLAHGRHGTLRLLDSTTVELMLTPYVWIPDPGYQGWQGLIWYQRYVNGDTLWCHEGGWDGVATSVAISQRDNSGTIVLTNGDPRQVGEAIVEVVMPALLEFAARAGIAEEPPIANRQPLAATIIRGVLSMAGSRQNTAYGAELLDISGRKVLDLTPGPNDISRLAPGVYFVREQLKPQAQAIRKVIVTG